MRDNLLYKRLYGALCFLLCTLFVFGGCTSPVPDGSSQTAPEVEEYQEEKLTPKQGGTLKLGLYEVDTLNPLTTRNSYNAQLLRVMFDGLFQLNADLSVSNRLCEKYTVSSDGKSYQFWLRSDAPFHDGSKLSAADVEYSFKLASAEGSLYQSRFDNVAGFSASGGTLRVNLKTPDPNLTALLDFPIIKRSSYLPPKPAAGQQLDVDYRPVGTGKYKLQSYKENKELYLVSNESWPLGAKPYIENVVMRILPDRQTAIYAFENMEIDLLTTDVINLGEYAPKRSLMSKEFTDNRLTFVGINHLRGKFAGAKTRQAVSRLIDRDKMIVSTCNGRAVATDIPVNPASFLYGIDPLSNGYDFNRARELLQEDGWEDTDQNGLLEKEFEGTRSNFSVELLVNEENGGRLKIAELLNDSLTQAGVSSTVVSVPYQTYTQRAASGAYDLIIGEMKLLPNQSIQPLREGFIKTEDAEFNRLLETASLSRDAAGLKNSYVGLCEYLRDSMPLIGVYYSNGALLFTPNLKGEINPVYTDPLANINQWFIAD